MVHLDGPLGAVVPVGSTADENAVALLTRATHAEDVSSRERRSISSEHGSSPTDRTSLLRLARKLQAMAKKWSDIKHVSATRKLGERRRLSGPRHAGHQNHGHGHHRTGQSVRF